MASEPAAPDWYSHGLNRVDFDVLDGR